ncbi:FecR family protein [Planctomycetota bacterium]
MSSGTREGRDLALEGLLREMGRDEIRGEGAFAGRIIQAVSSEAAPPRRRRAFSPAVMLRPFLIGAAACIAIVTGLHMLRDQASPPLPAACAHVVEAEGLTLIHDGADAPGTEDASLRPSDTLITAADGRAVFMYAAEATAVSLEGNTSLRIEGTPRGKQLILNKGRLTCYAAPQPAGRPLTIITAQARAAVVGTIFSIQTDGRTTRVEVTEGAVRMHAAGERGPGLLVDAGRCAAVAKGHGPALEDNAPAPAAETVMRRETCAARTGWIITAWRDPGHIEFGLDRRIYASPPAALRLTYDFPDKPVDKVDDIWLANHRSLDRTIRVPAGTTHVRLKLHVVRTAPEAVFTLSLWDGPRKEAWGWRTRLAGREGKWLNMEHALARMPELWSHTRGDRKGDAVPPVAPETIRILELGLNLGSAEVVVDDIEFFRREPSKPARP